MSKKNTLAGLAQALEEVKERARREGEAALKGSFAEFFEAHPEASAILWTQYTPYFNDGEACTFDINDFELKLDPEKMADDLATVISDRCEETDEDDDTYGFGEGDDSAFLRELPPTDDNRSASWNSFNERNIPLRELTESEASLLKDFDELESACMSVDDILQAVLGDHVTVKATREGFETRDYEHD